MPDESTPARQCVEAEIRANGPITFARFMEIALYGEHGYYTSSPKADADYATSPQMHPAFGVLIAGWLFRAWQALGEPGTFEVVELGAGDGGLARDILDAGGSARDFDDRRTRFCEALRYHSFDIRPRGSVCDVDDLPHLKPVVGCVISNELLDAFPANVFTVRNRKVLECYVGVGDAGELAFVEGEASSDEIVYRVAEFVSIMPDGYRGEVNLRLNAWAKRVAEVLERGHVLTIDYGHERDMLYHPLRYQGSLRCYRDHVLGQNPFRNIGLQDMTTHVDFTAVNDVLNGIGFEAMAALRSQRDFLFDLGIGEYIRQVRLELARSKTDAEMRRLASESRALNSLVDPRGLGGFKVAQHAFKAPSVDIGDLETSPMFPRPESQSRHLNYVPYD